MNVVSDIETLNGAARGKGMSAAEAAQIEFEPIDAETIEGMEKLASWEGLNNPYLVFLRVATLVARKSKPELIDLSDRLWSTPLGVKSSRSGKRSNLLEDVFLRFDDSAELFRGLAEFIEMANLRLLIASAACCEKPKVRGKRVRSGADRKRAAA